MTEHPDVTVIGAGATGLAAARSLARSGHRVLLLERYDLAHERGSSHGESRIVRLAHDNPADVADAVAALELWRQLEHDRGVRLLFEIGGIEFGPRVEDTRAALTENGIASEVLEPAELERRFPMLLARGEPGLWQADSAIVLADVALAELAKDAIGHGAEIRTGVRVTGLVPGERSVTLHTDNGEIVTGAVVVATGAWIGELAAQAGVPLPVTATLQSPAYLRLDTGRGPVPTLIDVRADGREYYALPDTAGTVLKGNSHNHGSALDLDGHRNSDAGLVADFVRWARGRYRGIDTNPVRSYGCIYSWLPGSRFHLQRHGRVVVASCCSGRGFKFTPLTGRRIADLVGELT